MTIVKSTKEKLIRFLIRFLIKKLEGSIESCPKKLYPLGANYDYNNTLEPYSLAIEDAIKQQCTRRFIYLWQKLAI